MDFATIVRRITSENCRSRDEDKNRFEMPTAGTFPVCRHLSDMSAVTSTPRHARSADLRDAAAIEDFELVQRVRRGDLSAFELIMRRYNRRLYRAAYGVLGGASEAEDVVQEAYFRAFAKLDTFAGPHGFATWLTRIATNEALMRLRGRGRIVSFSDYANPSSRNRSKSIENLRTADPSPERLAQNLELRLLLERAIAALPKEFRAVFILREVERLSVSETAESLGVREETVKTRLHRAKQRLRRSLGGEIEAVMPTLYEFAGRQCDQIVDAVLKRLRTPRPGDWRLVSPRAGPSTGSL